MKKIIKKLFQVMVDLDTKIGSPVPVSVDECLMDTIKDATVSAGLLLSPDHCSLRREETPSIDGRKRYKSYAEYTWVDVETGETYGPIKVTVWNISPERAIRTSIWSAYIATFNLTLEED